MLVSQKNPVPSSPLPLLPLFLHLTTGSASGRETGFPATGPSGWTLQRRVHHVCVHVYVNRQRFRLPRSCMRAAKVTELRCPNEAIPRRGRDAREKRERERGRKRGRRRWKGLLHRATSRACNKVEHLLSCLTFILFETSCDSSFAKFSIRRLVGAWDACDALCSVRPRKARVAHTIPKTEASVQREGMGTTHLHLFLLLSPPST